MGVGLLGKQLGFIIFLKRRKKTSATDHGYLHKTEANQLWKLQVLFLYPYLLPDEESKNRGISDENLLQTIKLRFLQCKNSESSRSRILFLFQQTLAISAIIFRQGME